MRSGSARFHRLESGQIDGVRAETRFPIQELLVLLSIPRSSISHLAIGSSWQLQILGNTARAISLGDPALTDSPNFDHFN